MLLLRGKALLAKVIAGLRLLLVGLLLAGPAGLRVL